VKDARPQVGPPRRSPAATASRRWTILSTVALLALVVRLVYIKQISHAPFFDLRLGDAESYHRWALRIANGDWLGEGVFYQAPLYPYFLAAVYKASGDSAAMVRFVQAVIGTGSCVLLAAAGMALFGEYGAVAGALLAIYPPAIFMDGLLEKSTLVSFFTAALLYLLSARHVRFREFSAGIVLGLLSLTRENALLIAAPVLSWFLMGDEQSLSDDSHGTRRLSWRAAAAFLGGCALVLLPVGARNYAVGGEFELTTSQFGPNLYIGNHAGAQGFYDSLVPGHGSAADERDDATRLAEEVSGRTLRPSEVSAFWTARALEFIRTQPGAWLRQLARKLALTYNAGEIADTESQHVYAESSSLLRALAPLSFGVIFCLAAFGVCMTINAWRRLWFLYAIALTYTLSIIIFYVFARYRFPLVPVLILFATGGLVAWREKPARPMRRWAVAALVLAGGLTYLPLGNTRIDRIAHYVNIANALLKDPGKWNDAAAFYDKALHESPRSPAAHFGMGMLLAQLHRPQEAAVHYRTAVAGWPDNAELRLNFALALLDAGDNEAALDELDAAFGLRAGDPAAHLIAGKLLLQQSRPADAWKVYERALAIQPKNLNALMGSGVALTQLRRPEEAIEKYRLALAVDPRNADAHDGLGSTLLANGRLTEARQEFERALSLNPDDKDARHSLERTDELLHGKHN
jgi:Flp pilus assembly protein TadD/4-amino-4-deoxy-L-arabinose transferase-like glycosyltransferase